MSVYFRAILFLLPFLAFFPSTASAFSCSAAHSDLNFGDVSVRGTDFVRTAGDIRVTCTGAPAGTVNICIFIGPGSGGAATGNNPRYLRSASGQVLEYTLRQNTVGGGLWNTFQFAASPDAAGKIDTTRTIWAEITSKGQDFKGSFMSTFSGSAHVQLSWGKTACDLGASTPSAFSVTANIVPTCSLTVGNLDFGQIPATINSPVYAQASINVSCSSNAPYTVTIGPGSGSGVTDPGARKMTNGPSTLAYGLYQNAGTSIPWGWTAGSNGYNGTGTGNTQLLTVYGKLNSGQTANVGTYTDSVVVTVTY